MMEKPTSRIGKLLANQLYLLDDYEVDRIRKLVNDEFYKRMKQ